MPSARSVSFTHPPTPAARLRRAVATVWAFLVWMVRAPAGPTWRWAPVGIALWLFVGAPGERYSSTPALHGAEQTIGTVIGVGLLVGLFCVWRTMVRGTSDGR